MSNHNNTDNNACKICMNCKNCLTEIYASCEDGSPHYRYVCDLTELPVSEYRPACQHFEPKEDIDE